MNELDTLRQIIDRHVDVPVDTEYSRNYAHGILGRCKVLGIRAPMVILRYMDRLHGPTDGREKISRDRFRKSYVDLSAQQQDGVDDLHRELSNTARVWCPGDFHRHHFRNAAPDLTPEHVRS